MSAENLDTLLADLSAPRFEKRWTAFNALLERIHGGSDAEVDALCARLQPLLKSKDSNVRARTLELLGAGQGEKAIPLLFEHASDADPEVRASVEDVAEELGEPGRPLLRKLVGDPEFGVRFWAAVALSEAGEAAGYDVLVEGLSTQYTRFEALQGLRRLGDRRAEAPVRKVFGKWFLPALDRIAAAGVLASFGDAEAKERLLKELGRRRSDVRGLAMEVVGELKLPEAAAALEAIFRDPDDPDRGSAAIALGAMRQEGRLEEFVARLRDESAEVEVRCDLAWALQRLGTEAARAALKDAALATKNEDVLAEIREALAAPAPVR